MESSTMNLATLYTLTGTGVRYWKIDVDRDGLNIYIVREYGKYGGKAVINHKLITIAKSKQTPYEQAIFEAKASWEEMKSKKGYVENLDQLQDTSSQLSLTHVPEKPKLEVTLKFPTVVDTEPEPERRQDIKFLPMLANKFAERKKYVKYPCMVQPKLDGIRYTARKLLSGEVILKTRNDAVCPFFSEIKLALSQLNLRDTVIIDGEFYSKKVPFKTLNGYCNRKKMEGKTGYGSIPKVDLESINYYIFDCYFIDDPTMSFERRYQYIHDILSSYVSDLLKLVPCMLVNSEEEIKPQHDKYVADGFEGIMIRNINSPYKLKDRSNDLLKYKNFYDTEFTIVGANSPSNGKEEGCIIWVLSVPGTELTFTCRPRDTYESRKADWSEFSETPESFIGKQYTVRYQEKYDNGVPRFPSGIAIRYDLN